MKWRRASSTWRILVSMLPLTSRASARRRGRRSPLKSVTFCRLPSSETWKSSPRSPSTGWPSLSRTETGTRTVRVRTANVGSSAAALGRDGGGAGLGKAPGLQLGHDRVLADARPKETDEIGGGQGIVGPEAPGGGNQEEYGDDSPYDRGSLGATMVE